MAETSGRGTVWAGRRPLGSELVVHAQAQDAFVETDFCGGKRAAAARVASRILEAGVKILEFDRPVVGYGVFDAGASGPARFGAAPVGQYTRRRFDVGEGATAGDVVQYALGGIADAATDRGEPVAGDVTAANRAGGADAVRLGVAEILPIDVGFGAEHEFADLVIAANLAAGQEAVHLVARHRSDRCSPGRGAEPPAGIETDIEAGPS